jgi:hypothetical protein
MNGTLTNTLPPSLKRDPGNDAYRLNYKAT